MQFIAISFTLKEQAFAGISATMEKLASIHPNAVLVHGFMPRSLVLEKGFPTNVVDTLDALFPLQLNCFADGSPRRQMMADIIKQNNGTVYTIGEIKDGVAEEVDIYTAASIAIRKAPLSWDGSSILESTTTEMSEGEFRVRTSFNVSNNSVVSEIKNAGAAFITLINDIKPDRDVTAREASSLGRLKSLAMTEAESATSWAVKAATI